MTPGLVAFFVIVSMLLAFYALLAPTNTKITTLDGDQVVRGQTGLFERIVRPALRNFLPQTPLAVTEYSRKNEGIRALLARTGNPWRVTPEEYVGVRILAVIAGIVVLTFLSTLNLFPVPVYLAIALGAFLGYIAPKAMIDARWSARRRDLNAFLPEALDLLRICMNAGLNFTNSLKQTTELLPPGVTRDELARVYSEVAAGLTLNEALESLAYRCPTDGVEAFVRAVSQANVTGSDISDTLAYQADETRAEYERIVETRAQKLQTTLFFPIILFLLPSLMVIIFGPSISSLSSSL